MVRVEGSIITDEMRKALRIGEELGRFTYEVEQSWIRRFATAIGDPNPHWLDEEYASNEGLFGGVIAPPTFFTAMDPVDTGEMAVSDDFLDTIPYEHSAEINAFNEVKYVQPIRPGDTITVTVSYSDVYEKEGSTGRLVFWVRESVLKNQRGEIVARTRSGHGCRYDLSRKKET